MCIMGNEIVNKIVKLSLSHCRQVFSNSMGTSLMRVEIFLKYNSRQNHPNITGTCRKRWPLSQHVQQLVIYDVVSIFSNSTWWNRLYTAANNRKIRSLNTSTLIVRLHEWQEILWREQWWVGQSWLFLLTDHCGC